MYTAAQFWNWFKENNAAYTFLDIVDEAIKEQLLNKFLQQLHQYCDNIYFEIGGHPDKDTELIITAEGNQKYFDKVEELIAAAPPVNGWTFIAFKPAVSGNFTSQWNDLKLNTEDLWFHPLSNKKNNDLGIRICFDNHDLIKDNNTLTPLLYKMLDTILGEKVFALDIYYLDTGPLPEDPEQKGLYLITELPAYVRWHKLQQAESSS